MNAHIFGPIDKAINAESWEWLNHNYPQLATAIQDAIEGGAKPDAIYRFVLARFHGSDRAGCALRCKQAAAHLSGE